MIPGNDFTRCYDKEKKLLEANKVAQATVLQNYRANTQTLNNPLFKQTC